MALIQPYTAPWGDVYPEAYWCIFGQPALASKSDGALLVWRSDGQSPALNPHLSAAITLKVYRTRADRDAEKADEADGFTPRSRCLPVSVTETMEGEAFAAYLAEDAIKPAGCSPLANAYRWVRTLPEYADAVDA